MSDATEDTRPAAKAHRAATGHEMAIVSAAASSCAECDWPEDGEEDATGDRSTEGLRVVVYHSLYGCDTGCCGHRVEIGDEEWFTFDHADGPNLADIITMARKTAEYELGEAHAADLDWAHAWIDTDDGLIYDYAERVVATTLPFKDGSRRLVGPDGQPVPGADDA